MFAGIGELRMRLYWLSGDLLINLIKAQRNVKGWQVRHRSIGKAVTGTNLMTSWPVSFPERVGWLRSYDRPPIVFSLLPTARMTNSVIANRNGGVGSEKKRMRNAVSVSSDAAVDNHHMIEVISK